ncbi:MAG: translation initiation factor IF-2 [Gemmataceae bacterium]
MQTEKVRIYQLAKKLNIESKDLLDFCRQAGIDVKNQLSSLDQEQCDAVELLVKKGSAGAAAPQAPPKSVAPTLAAPPGRVRQLPTGRSPASASRTPAKDTGELKTPAEGLEPAAPTPSAGTPAVVRPPSVNEPAKKSTATPAGTPSTPASPNTSERPPQRGPGAGPTAPQTPGTIPPQAPAAKLSTSSGDVPKVRDLSGRGSAGPGRAPTSGTTPRTDTGPRPGGKRPIPRVPGIRVASVPPLRARPQEIKKPQQPIPSKQQPIAYLPPEVASGSRPINTKDLVQSGKGSTPAANIIEDFEEEDSEAAKGKAKLAGGVAGRAQRHKSRNERAQARKGRDGETFEARAGTLVIEEERPQRTKSRLERLKAKQRGPTQPRKGKVVLETPITVRSLSEAIGKKSGEILFKLKDLAPEVNFSINSSLDEDTAMHLALDLGVEMEIKRHADAEVELSEGLQEPENPENLVPRAPIVTVMGHVDHGKTSLLDQIRKSDVAASEAGGITQVIRAWRVDHNGKPITFLDTPGHEAFTKMRARGANVTDIAVIVVAADDGVMPQTEEAINHAKAAGVAIIVAINKIDLPNANVKKTEQQLYGMELIPDTMGGDIPFVYTSAATGKGIDELLEAITLVAEYTKELKANPNKPARGTCLEAMLSEGEGVQATLLVQNGTLRRGDVILCGAAHGRVRAMYNDLGQPIDEAGPSMPVRITGLDEVPNASDPFHVVPDLMTAREIADKRRSKQQEAAIVRREPVRLENLSVAKIVELKVILKADFRGSIEAINKELEKLHHEEVRVRLLSAAIGGITENDINLALASPEDTLVVGFNAVPDDRARALAEERGVQIRQYDIIYKLTDDIRSALEGKLKPREEVVHLGRAVVRETFKISRTGTIAGCYVTQGVIERSAKVRLIREGIVIYPPVDRTAGLDSLKRFKEDVREVREGFECGLKIAGYDDIKVGDVVEAYRVEHIQRTLS